LNILAADIGGTKSWLSLYQLKPDSGKKTQPVILFEKIYKSADFTNFDSLLDRFLTENGPENPVDKMCLALPGVIKQRHTTLTNLQWELDADQLEQHFSIKSVCFVNDFEAAAMGLETLQQDDLLELNAAARDDKAICVITGAGTGLGLAWLDNTRHPVKIFATEGGHCDFAPTNDLQIALLKFLQKKYHHVSYERILSGPGLVALYAFLDTQASGDGKIISSQDMADVPTMAKKIHQMADQGQPQAVACLTLFVEVYASYIANLALLYKPQGGIYIAGGIAAKIQSWMQKPGFTKSYLNKGRMRDLVSQIPVFLVTNDRLGLQGAMRCVENPMNNNVKEIEKNERDS